MTKPDLTPPWTLFIDKNKPVAILPSGRPGEVADVRHLSMERAEEIVYHANKLHSALVMAKLEHINARLEQINAFTRATDLTEAEAHVLTILVDRGESRPLGGFPLMTDREADAADSLVSRGYAGKTAPRGRYPLYTPTEAGRLALEEHAASKHP